MIVDIIADYSYFEHKKLTTENTEQETATKTAGYKREKYEIRSTLQDTLRWKSETNTNAQNKRFKTAGLIGGTK